MCCIFGAELFGPVKIKKMRQPIVGVQVDQTGAASKMIQHKGVAQPYSFFCGLICKTQPCCQSERKNMPSYGSWYD